MPIEICQIVHFESKKVGRVDLTRAQIDFDLV